MSQKITVDVDKLHELVYTWVINDGIKRIRDSKEGTNAEELFKAGAFVFMEKLRELTEHM